MPDRPHGAGNTLLRRVLIGNGAVLVGAVVVLALSPATASDPVTGSTAGVATGAELAERREALEQASRVASSMAWSRASSLAVESAGSRRRLMRSMRLIVARCEVEYSGRLSARLPEALRLLMVKADGPVLVHADAGGYKPLN
jgi:hypothetical protein